jgi:CheY-like chemotaxis protein/two-component sensor histidine kinase
MVRLVDDLMEVSRITRGSIELRLERVSLADVVRSAVETSAPAIESARHRLTLDLPSEPVYVEADSVRLAQVFGNLLNNAAKYTPEGGDIAVRARVEGGQAVVSVRDTGTGIAPESLPQVFELFVQEERTYSRAQGGLGIGLTLARSLVQLHGGSVEARSDGPGRGSEFTVRLPMIRKGPEVAEPTSHGAAVESGVALQRVLVVDDNRDAADSLAMLLQVLGSDVHTAHDGASALDAFVAYRPTLAFLDIGMPGMDGYELARRARQLPGGQETILIALSGWGQDADRRRSREAGIDHHLVKPVDISVLRSLLATLTTRAALGSSVPG